MRQMRTAAVSRTLRAGRERHSPNVVEYYYTMVAQNEDRLMTVREVARMCGRSEETVRRWIWSGKLASQKLGNQFFVERRDIEELKHSLTAANQSRHTQRESKFSKASWRESMEQDRKLRESLFAKYGYFDVAAMVRQSRDEH